MTLKNRTIVIQLLGLLVIGGILTMVSSYRMGVESAEQTVQELSKFGAEEFIFVGVGTTLIRELCPITVGLTVAFLTPILSIAAYLTIKQMNLGDSEKEKILVSSKFISLLIATPLLVIIGSFVGIIAAKQSSDSSLQHLFDFLGMKDIIYSILKSVVLGAGVGAVGIFQVKQFFKKVNIIFLILTFVVTIIAGALTVLLLDYSIAHLFF